MRTQTLLGFPVPPAFTDLTVLVCHVHAGVSVSGSTLQLSVVLPQG